MSNHFVVGVEDLTKDQEADFSKYLTDNGCGWWHRIPNFWLVTDPSSRHTSKSLSDKIHSYNMSSQIIVTSVNPVDFYNFYSSTDTEKTSLKWLGQFWLNQKP